MPGTIQHAEQHDGAVFAEENITEQGSKKRCEVDETNKLMIALSSLCIRHRIAYLPIHQPEILGHKDHKDRPHSIKGKTFCSLIADDVWDARRHRGGVQRDSADRLAHARSVWGQFMKVGKKKSTTLIPKIAALWNRRHKIFPL